MPQTRPDPARIARELGPLLVSLCRRDASAHLGDVDLLLARDAAAFRAGSITLPATRLRVPRSWSGAP